MEPDLACCLLVLKGSEDTASPVVVPYSDNPDWADAYVRDAARSIDGLSLGTDTIGKPTTVIVDPFARMNISQAESIMLIRINAAAAISPHIRH